MIKQLFNIAILWIPISMYLVFKENTSAHMFMMIIKNRFSNSLLGEWWLPTLKLIWVVHHDFYLIPFIISKLSCGLCSKRNNLVFSCTFGNCIWVSWKLPYWTISLLIWPKAFKNFFLHLKLPLVAACYATPNPYPHTHTKF